MSAAAKDAALVVEGVWKAYRPDAPPVVKDVGFTLGQGQFMTLLGPSGSGKTTTLMMVAGFEAPTWGRIFARGRDVSTLPPNRRDFGVVFQGYALFPHMTVQDNVEFALRMRRVEPAARRRRGLEMLDKVGLSAFAGRKPRELSGGQQQRVALARALAAEPDVLLLDEPLGALDKKMRETLQAEIKDIQRKTGVSVLFITHDQEEAMMMSDVVAVMEDGRIAQIGSPEEVYNHPVDPFVAAFLGETNLLPCEPGQAVGDLLHVRLEGGGEAVVRCAAGSAPSPGAWPLLSLRPERIRLLAPGETADNVMEAELVERVFLGRQTRYILKAMGRTVVAVGAGGGDVGQTVRLGWSAADAQLLAERPIPA